MKKKEHALWLNASDLTDDEFDELTELFSHYANGTAVIKIKRGAGRYRMSNVNDCRGLREELRLFLDDKDIIEV